MYEQTCPELLKWIIIDQQNEVSFLVSRRQLYFTQVSYICRHMVDFTSAGVLKVSVVKRPGLWPGWARIRSLLPKTEVRTQIPESCRFTANFLCPTTFFPTPQKSSNSCPQQPNHHPHTITTMATRPFAIANLLNPIQEPDQSPDQPPDQQRSNQQQPDGRFPQIPASPRTPHRQRSRDLSRDDKIRIRALHDIAGWTYQEILVKTNRRWTFRQIQDACTGPRLTPQKNKKKKCTYAWFLSSCVQLCPA